ncbi:hypothetical protein, conserved [Plasmodium gonderi]|uniref:RRM domain-containing protein n=1 Tax=Plasmodium gonderi TaxID=77519 RepID=A0A1Y1JK32_PLAGO|nr:hypothetical protein, conserved [Plasmodium gonderi]GAW82630.1 hypothetical protein, conserved [Plasmodium gonderi]
MTDVQMQNQTSSLNTSKKDYENRYDDKAPRTLCVKNISKETKESELLDLFKKFGSIESINLKVNKNIGPYAIYAHVLFSAPEEAKRCLKQMNGKILNGRALRIDFKRNNNKIVDDNDDDGNSNVNNYQYMNSNNNSGNNNGSIKSNVNYANVAMSNNKFHRKINRNNHFYNHRYSNNNKRMARNDGTLNEDNINPYDSETIKFREHEQVNKRLRTGGNSIIENMKISNQNNLNSQTNLHRQTNLNRKDVDINKLIKTYDENKILSKPNNDVKNNQVEEILQFLIKDAMNNPPRIKLYLCDHLRKCAQHVFNRPSINLNIANSNVKNNIGSNNESNGISNTNRIIGNPTAQLHMSEQSNMLIGLKQHMINNELSNKKKMVTQGNDNLLNVMYNGGLAKSGNNILNMDLNKPTNLKYSPWKGILEMRNKENLNIIGYELNGETNKFLNNNITNIIISHRKKMKNIPKIATTYYFQIENKEDKSILDSYKNYFNSKDRVGLSSMSEDWHMYLIFPGSPIFNEFYNTISDMKNLIGSNSLNSLNNIFIGIVCYNPQISERKNVGAPLRTQNPDTTTVHTFNQSNIINVNQTGMTSNIPNMKNQHKSNFTNATNGIDPNWISNNNAHNNLTKQGISKNIAMNNNLPMHNNTLNLNNIQGATNNKPFITNNLINGGNSSSNFPLEHKKDTGTAITTQVVLRNNQNAPKINTSQNNFNTQLNQVNDISEENRKEENKNEVPNWLNQFSSLAAYLVKK